MPRPVPTDRVGRVLAVLKEHQGQPVSTYALRAATGLTKGGLSSVIYALRHRYGYTIESQERQQNATYTLLGRREVSPYPPLGRQMVIQGMQMHDDGVTATLTLRAENGVDYDVVFTPTEALQVVDKNYRLTRERDASLVVADGAEG